MESLSFPLPKLIWITEYQNNLKIILTYYKWYKYITDERKAFTILIVLTIKYFSSTLYEVPTQLNGYEKRKEKKPQSSAFVSSM